MSGLAGKAALVTGASSGMGEATAVALAAAGVMVAVAARRPEPLQDLVGRIEATGGEAIALPGDVTDEAVATGIVEETVRRFGRLDILVNSAGTFQAGGVENASTADWRRLIELNLLAALYTCKAAVPPMKAQGGGDIVNVSSIAGRRANGSFGPYATSKFGLTALTEGLRQEVGLAGIRVCIIEPGLTNSAEGAMTPDDIAAAILFVVSLPARANVSEMLIRPTIDVTPM